MKPERAERIAIDGLGWLAGNDELCPVFLGSTGAAPEDLRQQVADPAFLASVLDFITMDDRWVMGFCDAAGYGYDEPLRARQALPGGAQINWT